MSRIVSVWLPRWPIQRYLATAHRNASSTQVDPAKPFVLSADGVGGPRIAALNAAAEHDGLAIGDGVADARARADGLQVSDSDDAADLTALRELALWATRYTPAVALCDQENSHDGFFLDVTGAAHLFGGEDQLIADISARLANFGLQAQCASAATAGAAWALSRYAPDTLLEEGNEARALAPLPVEALRLPPDMRLTLHRLGLKKIGHLTDQPRAPFAARFERILLQRLDQALGRASEPLRFVITPPVYHSIRYLMEPVLTQPGVLRVAARLMKDILHPLTRDGRGARGLRLMLYGVDGHVRTLDIAAALPTRDVAHVIRMIELRLDRLPATLESDFGFEGVGLAVTEAAPMDDRQRELTNHDDQGEDAEKYAAMIDTLRQRLGPHSVTRLAPRESHIPERAEAWETTGWETTTGPQAAWPAPDPALALPLFLLPDAEPAQVTALVPEGPPQHFRWRDTLRKVVHAEGPRRIAGEWWRSRAPTRDYYLVEDESGHRFWLYREGLYERENVTPRWFVHGLFA